MMYVILVLLVCVATANAFVPRLKTRGTRGTCVEECDSGRWPDLELPDCQEGYVCRSNGCGHTCQKIINSKPKRQGTVGICVEECGHWPDLELPDCQDGYECRSNGCGHTCQKIIASTEEPVFGVCAELCGAGCEEGFACLSNGCGHSCQPVSS